MNTIHVSSAAPYDIQLGPGLLGTLGETLRQHCPQAQRVVLVSDERVFSLYGQPALQSLSDAGYCPVCHLLPGGEGGKNPENLLNLLNHLTGEHITRTDALAALGGGATGDLTGFAAAIYMRGIRYVQVPTTLLAMADSSVGGKTAVNLPAGKNLIGAFHSPAHVLCDLDALRTLPEHEFLSGCAEIVKTAVLFDPDLFSALERDGRKFDPKTVLTRCIQHKGRVVAADEYDRSERALLNFGHTIGHALEEAGSYALTHGEAVAIGMAVTTRAAAKAGYCSPELPERLCSLLESFSLPTSSGIPFDLVFAAMASDKKRSGPNTGVILPLAPGRCIQKTMDSTELFDFFQSGY